MQNINNQFSLLLGMPGGSEWILILVVVLLIFGGKKIPELMRGLGKGVREFKDAKGDVEKEIEDGTKEKAVKETPTPAATTNNITPPPTPPPVA
jgi:sec-independent protein translocase protein TatA